MQRTLLEGGATPTDRNRAAQKLLARADGVGFLLGILNEGGNPDAQQSVAKALAAAPEPRHEFVVPLINLLSVMNISPTVAEALAAYQGRDEDGRRARQALMNFANNSKLPPKPRAGVIRAMGKIVHKTIAQALINLLKNDNSLVRDAAIDALLQMTGLSANGRDIQKWQRWWDSAADRDELQWSVNLLSKNAGRAFELERRLLVVREQRCG